MTEIASVDVALQEGQFFVMGDNRDHASDSRNFGAVSAHNITHRYAYTAASFNFGMSPCEVRIAKEGRPPAECADVETGDLTLDDVVRRWRRAQVRWDRWVRVMP